MSDIATNHQQCIETLRRIDSYWAKASEQPPKELWFQVGECLAADNERREIKRANHEQTWRPKHQILDKECFIGLPHLTCPLLFTNGNCYEITYDGSLEQFDEAWMADWRTGKAVAYQVSRREVIFVWPSIAARNAYLEGSPTG